VSQKKSFGEMTTRTVKWYWSGFDGLDLDDLYEILSVRQAVFVVEQNCPFKDIDGLDKQSWHLLGRIDGELVAYARVSPPGVRGENPSIGRILTADAWRAQGIGKSLVKEGIRRTKEVYPRCDIGISAQVHLQEFYNHFGFESVSLPYDEDGIPHIDMLLRYGIK
jgi:ElaA protein